MTRFKKAGYGKVFEMDKIPQKLEKDFIGLWETLTWEFLGRLKESFLDKKTKWEDFEHIRILGEGGFGKVTLSKHKKTKNYFALKVMEKERIIKGKQLHFAINEKYILSLCKFKFILKLITAFQTNDNICYCLELAPGGDLYALINKHAPFCSSIARFYGGQVVLGLQYLHTMKIIYRDLKPENILISNNGYIKLADMGFAKLLQDNPRTYTFCGTPEYIAPEVILNKGYGTAIDWWSYGIMLYEFFFTSTPFYHRDQMKMFKHITKGNYKIPNDVIDDAKNLIKCLLQVDTTKRIGNLRNGALDVRYHSFFKITDWTSLMDQSSVPPFPINDEDFSTITKDDKVDQLNDKSSTMNYAEEFQRF